MSTARALPSVVHRLILRAERLSRHGRGTDSRAVFAVAIAADPTPAARIAYAVDLAKSDPEEAISQLELACEQARRLRSPSFRALCCRNLALLLRRLGNNDFADRYQQMAIAAEMDCSDFPTQGTFDTGLLVDIASAWSLSERDGPSADVLLLAAERNATDVCEQAAIVDLRGVIAARRLQWGDAARHLLKAASRFHEGDDLAGVAHALVNVGHVFQCQRRFSEARRAFQMAASLYESSADDDAAERARSFGRESASFERLEDVNPHWN